MLGQEQLFLNQLEEEKRDPLSKSKQLLHVAKKRLPFYLPFFFFFPFLSLFHSERKVSRTFVLDWPARVKQQYFPKLSNLSYRAELRSHLSAVSSVNIWRNERQSKEENRNPFKETIFERADFTTSTVNVCNCRWRNKSIFFYFDCGHLLSSLFQAELEQAKERLGHKSALSNVVSLEK